MPPAPIKPSTCAPTVDIDLDAVCANYRTVKEAAPGAGIAAVVKCNAYGLGLAPVAQALAARAKCRKFFVAYPWEGAQLREKLAAFAPNAAIYVFNGPSEDSLADFAAFNLSPVLNSREQARLWAKARPGAAAALHIDTGMNRLGAPLDELDDIAAMRGLKITLVMSHLACGFAPGHEMNRRQHRAFEKVSAVFPSARRSLAASAGAFMGGGFHYDVVRAGVALYGVGPFDRPDPRLRPVVTLRAPVIQIRAAEPGESAGYGATHAIDRPARLATVALGYGDGLPRVLGNKGTAWLAGARCPIVGRVSMDLTILDVTNAPQAVEIGQKAEFYGARAPIEDAAAAAGTIGYELLTGLGDRLLRRYLLDGRPIDPDAIEGDVVEGKRR